MSPVIKKQSQEASLFYFLGNSETQMRHPYSMNNVDKATWKSYLLISLSTELLWFHSYLLILLKTLKYAFYDVWICMYILLYITYIQWLQGMEMSPIESALIWTFGKKQIAGKSPVGDGGNCVASRCLFYWL